MSGSNTSCDKKLMKVTLCGTCMYAGSCGTCGYVTLCAYDSVAEAWNWILNHTPKPPKNQIVATKDGAIPSPQPTKKGTLWARKCWERMKQAVDEEVEKAIQTAAGSFLLMNIHSSWLAQLDAYAQELGLDCSCYAVECKDNNSVYHVRVYVMPDKL